MPIFSRSASVRDRSLTPATFCAGWQKSEILQIVLQINPYQLSTTEDRPWKASSHSPRPSFRRYWHTSSTPHLEKSCSRQTNDTLFSGVLKPSLEVETATNGRFRFSMFTWWWTAVKINQTGNVTLKTQLQWPTGQLTAKAVPGGVWV